MEHIKFMNAQQAKLVHLFKNTKTNVKNNMWFNICISMHLLVYCTGWSKSPCAPDDCIVIIRCTETFWSSCICKQYILMHILGTYIDYSVCICIHHWSQGVFDDFWWCSWLCRICKCVSLLGLLFYGICCHIW